MNKIFKFKLFSFIFLNKFNALDIKNIDISYFFKDDYFVSYIFSPDDIWIGGGVEQNILHNLYFNAGLNFNFPNTCLNNSFTSLSLRYYFVTIKYKLFFNKPNLNLRNLLICFTLNMKPIKITFDFFRASSLTSYKNFVEKPKRNYDKNNPIDDIIIKLKKNIYGENFDINILTTEDILNHLKEDEYETILEKYSLWLDLFKFIHDNKIPNCSYDEIIQLPAQINLTTNNTSFVNISSDTTNKILITNTNKKNTIILNNIIYVDSDLIEEKLSDIKLGLSHNIIVNSTLDTEINNNRNPNFLLTMLKQFLSFEKEWTIETILGYDDDLNPIIDIKNTKYTYKFV